MANSSFTGFAGLAQPATVGSSRNLTADDNGRLLQVTADDITLTIPAGIPAPFFCLIYPNTTTSIAVSGGATINGGTTTLVRSSTSTPTFGIMSLPSAANSYHVQGY